MRDLTKSIKCDCYVEEKFGHYVLDRECKRKAKYKFTVVLKWHKT